MPGTPYWSWYSASKHALNAMTEALYLELEGFGVRIVCIEPGFFRTDIVTKSIDRADIADEDPYASHQEWLARYYLRTIEEQSGDPAEVASAIVGAADDPDTPVHVLVGEDAAMVVDMVAELGSMEAWRPAAVAHASSIAGPRPPR
jgi:NAD(P)-dependent dehydrogenase (short-subunit alcohol dehydrogenase family)